MILSASRFWFGAFVIAGLSAAACGPVPAATQPPEGSESAAPTSSAAPTAAPTASETAAPPSTAAPAEASSDPGGTAFNGCRLPAPKKSDDACKTDADCGPSEPCHAHACVARAKAHPPDKTTICTRQMDCSSIDANPCSCFEGVCALLPPKS